MNVLHLINVVPARLPVIGYRTLAGGGLNIIRKYVGKYQGLQVGDNVVMHYTHDAQSKDPKDIVAVEHLRVSAIAIAPLDLLLVAHAVANHDYEANLKERILFFYPLPEASEGQPPIVRDPDTLYVAIYF